MVFHLEVNEKKGIGRSCLKSFGFTLLDQVISQMWHFGGVFQTESAGDQSEC
jgi:hypothetical protein